MENLSFENAYEKLNSLVSEIENSQLDLNSVVENYRQANDLLKYCQDLLSSAQQKLTVISQDEIQNLADPK